MDIARVTEVYHCHSRQSLEFTIEGIVLMLKLQFWHTHPSLSFNLWNLDRFWSNYVVFLMKILAGFSPIMFGLNFYEEFVNFEPIVVYINHILHSLIWYV